MNEYKFPGLAGYERAEWDMSRRALAILKLHGPYHLQARGTI